MVLPEQLELSETIQVTGTDWIRKKGEIVNVTYEIQNGYYGRRSDVYYPPKILSVKITDCPYPVVWFHKNFKGLCDMKGFVK